MIMLGLWEIITTVAVGKPATALIPSVYDQSHLGEVSSTYLAAETPHIKTNSARILPNHNHLHYSGRLDWQDPQAPSFGFPGTAVQLRFKGTKLSIEVSEDNWNAGNYIDVLIDDRPRKTIQLKPNLIGQPMIYNLAEGLEDKVHQVTIIKRNDYITGEFKLHSLTTDGELLPPKINSDRTIEVYGDSISAASVVEYPVPGVQDPENHNEALSNAYWSYAAILARKYDAELSLVAQSGASLIDGYGYWHNNTGMQAFYDKVKPLKDAPVWNFQNYTPDLVIIALGQNDSATITIGEDMSARDWKQQYKELIATLRTKYPHAYFIGMFPNMYHDRQWDNYLTEAIAEYRQEYDDPRVFSLINPQVTPGHPRISEQKLMADTLQEFIDNTLMKHGFNWDAKN